MKGYLGIYAIILTFYFFGSIYGSTFTFSSDKLGYFIIFLLTLINALMINRLNNRYFFAWLFLSIVPGVGVITHARFYDGPGGFLATRWDNSLWTFGMPLVFFFFQLISLVFISVAFYKHKKRTAKT